MNKHLQILTNIAVLAGIILLVYELNQASNLTRAEVYDAAWSSAVTRNLTLLGESPAETLAKALYTPEDLSQSDALILNQFYNSLLTSWYRNKDPRGIGYFGVEWEQIVLSEAYLLNSKPGRAWWASVSPLVDPTVVAVVDEYLAQVSPSAARTTVDAILSVAKQPLSSETEDPSTSPPASTPP